MERQITHTFAHDPAEIARARRVVAATLRAWGAETDPTLLVVVSELMTNAVRHGRGVVQLRLALNPDTVRVEVHDEGDGHPARRSPQQSGLDLGGFGLNLVDAIASDWGVDERSGTTVWAETSRSEASDEAGHRHPLDRSAGRDPLDRPGDAR